jgi:DNA-binding NarL/FixJ family response regulator
LELLEKHNPDLIVMDISMPIMDGVEAAKKAIEKYPDLKILTLSSFGDEKYYYKMVEAGVKGFVLKNSGISELEHAIQEVYSGGNWFSNELLQKVIINIGKPPSKETDFSDREIEVLKFVCDGLTNDQIAEKIHLSPDTVKWHRNNLLSKTGCNNTAALIIYAIKRKIIEI